MERWERIKWSGAERIKWSGAELFVRNTSEGVPSVRYSACVKRLRWTLWDSQT
jgi:hypothetical protein